MLFSYTGEGIYGNTYRCFNWTFFLRGAGAHDVQELVKWLAFILVPVILVIPSICDLS